MRMRIYISQNLKLFLMMFFLSVSLSAQAESNVAFFSSLEDVPIAPGISELQEQTVLYDKPEGRIIESVASMNEVSQSSVLSFYHRTLPQMGWNKISGTRFYRETEFLDIVFENNDGQNFVRVLVKPSL